jgi:hypothetical protein
MTKKILNASEMGKLGIKAMLQRIADEHCDGDASNNFRKARAWIAAENKRRKGEHRGGRPQKYPPCTYYKQTEQNPRHRFVNGKCRCGVKKNSKLELA